MPRRRAVNETPAPDESQQDETQKGNLTMSLDVKNLNDHDLEVLFASAAVELSLRGRLFNTVLVLGNSDAKVHKQVVAQMGDAADQIFPPE